MSDPGDAELPPGGPQLPQAGPELPPGRPELPQGGPELPPLPPAPPPPPPPERFPFWGYVDLLLFLGFAVVGLIAGAALVKIVLALSRLHVHNPLFTLLPAQFLGYLVLFLLTALMFRVQYNRPFWSSMRWVPPRMSAGTIIGLGVLVAFAVAFGSKLLHTPDIPTPMSKMLADRGSMLLVAVFGITLGPLCEELIFRGFLQPLFVRSVGPAGGILLAAIPFGLLHLQEYGNSWRHGLLITTAGAAFGWMRYRTGSTLASTVMHAAYNATFFAALLTQWKTLPH